MRVVAYEGREEFDLTKEIESDCWAAKRRQLMIEHATSQYVVEPIYRADV